DFKFTANGDGSYWFAVRTIDFDGRAYPPTNDRLRPDLKVIVDTKKPVVSLSRLAPRDGEVGVEWEVKDDNIDLNSMRLEYRLPGLVEWTSVGGGELLASG